MNHALSMRSPNTRRASVVSLGSFVDALDANNPIQATDLRIMHDQELLRRAQYN
jgi:hypothetical protein